MIRALALLVGLALGAVLAACIHGRMAHLRLIADLPGWTDAIAADATVQAGRADLAAGFAITWRMSGLDLRGPVWQGVIDRQDTRLAHVARLHWRDGFGLWVRVEAGTASLDGPLLSGHFTDVAGTGSLGPGGLWLDLDARSQRLTVDGVPRPDGLVTVTVSPEGWRLALPGAEPWQQTGADHGLLLGAPATR